MCECILQANEVKLYEDSYAEYKMKGLYAPSKLFSFVCGHMKEKHY